MLVRLNIGGYSLGSFVLPSREFGFEAIFDLSFAYLGFNKFSPIHNVLFIFRLQGGVAQMVERSLSMREVPGSIPGISRFLY